MASKLSPTLKLNNGKEIPLIGLGTWKSPAGQVYQAVKDAVEAGYRHIDCAYVYGNEDEVGRALKELFAKGKVKREDLFITSKCWNTFHKKELVPVAIGTTLKDLQLDYVDLYLVHWPHAFKEGGEKFPVDANGVIQHSDVDYLETWQALEECVQKGQAKSIGLSNFNSEQIDRVIKNSKIKPVALQVECHPYLNQTKLIKFCQERNIVVTAYSPLGSPDRPWAKPEDPTLLDEPKIKEIAAKHNKTTAQILIKFQVQRNVVVIPKSVTKSRIISNLDVFDFQLTKEDMETIESFDRGYRFVPCLRDTHHKYYPFSIPF